MEIALRSQIWRAWSDLVEQGIQRHPRWEADATLIAAARSAVIDIQPVSLSSRPALRMTLKKGSLVIRVCRSGRPKQMSSGWRRCCPGFQIPSRWGSGRTRHLPNGPEQGIA